MLTTPKDALFPANFLHFLLRTAPHDAWHGAVLCRKCLCPPVTRLQYLSRMTVIPQSAYTHDTVINVCVSVRLFPVVPLLSSSFQWQVWCCAWQPRFTHTPRNPLSLDRVPVQRGHGFHIRRSFAVCVRISARWLPPADMSVINPSDVSTSWRVSDVVLTKAFSLNWSLSWGLSFLIASLFY